MTTRTEPLENTKHKPRTDTGSPQSTRRKKGGFRPDIEGLRAVAIGMVLIYHAAPQYLPGGFIGVDIFFVISGYLITTLLLKEVSRTGTVSLRDFYARRARRLLPAATIVLAFCALVTWFVLPMTQRRVFGGDIMSSAVSLVNWRLADRSVDYLAEGTGASPVQHFWSLAVEEQFYLVWPVLIVLFVILARRFGWSFRAVLAVGLGTVAVGSFVWSVAYTNANPEAAFFVTTTRLWELALGAAVAMGAAWWSKVPRWIAEVLFVGGLVAIVTAAFAIDASVNWPGAAAMWPVLGTAAVLIGGSVVGTSLSAVVLTNRPMVWIGGISYSLYLWHWPMLIAAVGMFGELRVRHAVLITVLSIVPAYLSLRLVENPVRYSKRLSRTPRAGIGLGAALAMTSVVAGVAIILPGAIAKPVVAVSAEGTAATPIGAAILFDDPTIDPSSVDSYPQIFPAPADATSDIPVTYDDGCQVNDATVEICEYGAEDPSRTVMLVGDSMANQWHSALDVIAKRHNWKLVTAMKSSCAFAETTTIEQEKLFTSCDEWNKGAIQAVRDIDPDLVITGQGAWRGLENRGDVASTYIPEHMVQGLVDRWQELSDMQIPVIAIADNPSPSEQLYECAEQHRTELSQCAFDPIHRTADVQHAAATQVDSATIVDLNRYICPNGRCPAVMGGVLMYRQGSHLTKTFVDSLVPVLEGSILQAWQEVDAR